MLYSLVYFFACVLVIPLLRSGNRVRKMRNYVFERLLQMPAFVQSLFWLKKVDSQERSKISLNEQKCDSN